MSKGQTRGKIDDEQILNVIKESDSGFSTAPDIASKLGYSRQGIDKRLRALRDRGLVKQEKLNPKMAIWRLAEN
jgi:biotin operon repressor